MWEEETNIEMAFKPLQTSERIFVTSPDGQALGYAKVLRKGMTTTQLYRFSIESKIRQQLGQYVAMAYLGAEDAALYAINLQSGKLRWRYTAGTAISRRPAALEQDVYVTSDREGLARIDRYSGEAMWKIPHGRELVSANAEADRFLAANNKFVYASDSSGRLLVLDRKRGVKLSTLPTHHFRFPVVNELTDRLYLASNDGLIVCLRDRDQIRQIRHRYALEQASSPILKLLEQKATEEPGKPTAPVKR